MGQSTIMMVLTVAFVLAVVSQSTNEKINTVTDSGLKYYSENVSANICNSATEMLLTEIAEDENFRIENLTKKEMLNGNVQYKVSDTTIDGKGKLKIRVIANYRGETTQNVLIASIQEKGFIPPTIKAAISTNNNIKTLGTLIVDGRDHDLNGNLIGGLGTLGIWTTGNYSQSGSSKVGGSSGSTDYSPTKPGNSNVIKKNQTWPGGYPDSPDKVLGGLDAGFPDGTLKSLAISGLEGSQYVTKPSLLSYLLKGITYVELPSGSSWISANIEGSGILAVHNSDKNAVIKNLNGTFKGMLIADDIDKIHGTIIGAVVGISPTPPSGNCIGNGDGKVLFSSEAIMKSSEKSGKTVDPKTYFGDRRVKIDYWLE